MSGYRREMRGPAHASGLTIIELMIVIAIVSIITVIAIPVYQQYTARAKVAEGMSLAAPLKAKIAEYYQTNSQWPSNNSEAGVPPPSTYETDFVEQIAVSQTAQDGTITITYKTSGITELTSSTNTLVYTPSVHASSMTVTWECDDGTVPTWALPPRCR